MAFVPYIPFEKASPDLQELYRQFGGANNTPANIVRIAGYSPKVMEAHMPFYRAIMMGASPLSRQQREMIATVVSAINKCHY